MPVLSERSFSISTILLGAAFLLAGIGLFQTLLPLRAAQEGFSTTVIGFLGTAYFGGFMAGCYLGPRFILSVGHVRCFSGAAAALTVFTLAFPMILDPYIWSALRLLSGLSLAVLFIVVESWLNDRSTNRDRGRILSIYIIVTNIVMMAGQLMINLADTRGSTLFMAVAILICAAIIPLALAPAAVPKPIPSAKLDLRFLFSMSPAGAWGCFLVGAAEGAFWSLGPVFAQDRGMQVSEVTLLMVAFVLGGTLSQWPLGWISDRTDRRYVIATTAIGTVGTGLILAFWAPPDFYTVFSIAVLHGALMVPLYALCVSHANDQAPNDRLVEISGGLLLVYSVGATIGPTLGALFMEGGPPGRPVRLHRLRPGRAWRGGAGADAHGAETEDRRALGLRAGSEDLAIRLCAGRRRLSWLPPAQSHPVTVKVLRRS